MNGRAMVIRETDWLRLRKALDTVGHTAFSQPSGNKLGKATAVCTFLLHLFNCGKSCLANRRAFHELFAESIDH